MQGEEMTILNNIASLINELLSMEKGNDMDAEAQPEVAEDLYSTGGEVEPKKKIMMRKAKKEESTEEEDEEEDEEENLMKGLEETPSDVSTANEPAEKRQEDMETPLTDASVDEVAKTILKMLVKKNQGNKVNKSAKSDVNNKIIKALSLLSKRVIEQDKALSNIFKGLGIADQIIQKNEIEVQKSKPLNNTNDVNKSLEYIASFIKNKEQPKQTTGQPIDEVRKTLGNKAFLSALIGQK